jgi:hypothetical protein
MLPVLLASYRVLGVLRRFDVSRYPGLGFDSTHCVSMT